MVRETDVLLMTGGDGLDLIHWMSACGLADMLPLVDDTAWVGLSRSSHRPRVGLEYLVAPAHTTSFKELSDPLAMGTSDESGGILHPSDDRGRERSGWR